MTDKHIRERLFKIREELYQVRFQEMVDKENSDSYQKHIEILKKLYGTNLSLIKSTSN